MFYTPGKTGTQLAPQGRDARDLHKGPGDPGTQSKTEGLSGRGQDFIQQTTFDRAKKDTGSYFKDAVKSNKDKKTV